MSGPLRDRFGFVARLDFYDAHDLDLIIRRSATKAWAISRSCKARGAIPITSAPPESAASAVAPINPTDVPP